MMLLSVLDAGRASVTNPDSDFARNQGTGTVVALHQLSEELCHRQVRDNTSQRLRFGKTDSARAPAVERHVDP